MTRTYNHALITGGSSGIGRAIAQRLVQSGSNVCLIARTESRLDAVKAELELLKCRANQQIVVISADVSEQQQIELSIQSAIGQLGPPDLLITSAGIAHPGYFTELPVGIFEQTMRINYLGTLYCVKSVLPSMIQQKKGHIVMISSGVGLVGMYGYTPYSPSKFAVRGLAESLRGELKVSGLRLSIVYPPDTDTPQLEVENLIKPLETKQITATAETLSAEQVAKAILKSIERNAFEITPGLEMSLLLRLHSLLSPLLQWYFDRIVIKTRSSFKP